MTLVGRRLATVVIALSLVLGANSACERNDRVAHEAPTHDAGVSVSHFGHMDCFATTGGSAPDQPRPKSGLKVCGPEGSASVTQWDWVRSVEGADEYAFRYAVLKAEGEAGASLEQTASGPMWLEPKQARTVRFRGEPVVVFETEHQRVLLHVPGEIKP